VPKTATVTKMNNNAAFRVFISKGLGGFDGGFAVAVLNDNVASNIKQGLARNFAKTIYDNMPALRTAQITGRGGELEINENGTKTMKTGGTKTLEEYQIKVHDACFAF
jgi:hypothetical protein